jgi:hypothetical protein
MQLSKSWNHNCDIHRRGLQWLLHGDSSRPECANTGHSADGLNQAVEASSDQSDRISAVEVTAHGG